jgi:hypothetical protein
MERRPKPAVDNPDRCVSPQAVNQDATLPYLTRFIEYGKITIGAMEPVGGVAIASEGRRTYVMLRRHGGETLDQLMIRLDHAIAKVVLEGTFTDEINAPR